MDCIASHSVVAAWEAPISLVYQQGTGKSVDDGAAHSASDETVGPLSDLRRPQHLAKLEHTFLCICHRRGSYPPNNCYPWGFVSETYPVGPFPSPAGLNCVRGTIFLS